jgi:hypothetical protein
MVRLPDPNRSFAVLIGSSSYQSNWLPDLPAVRNNLTDLAAALTHPEMGGLSPERCIRLTDPASVREVYRALREYARRVEDTLIIYYAGHGLTGSLRNELYLALTDTDLDELPVSALDFDMIRSVFEDCPAINRVLILDCCFSGRAAQGFMADSVLGQVEVSGTYTLASTSANALAAAPPGARYTAFTGELLSLLHNGIPRGPELLSLGTIFRRLRHTMATRRLPIPTQRGTDTADLLALARNPAYRRPQPPNPGSLGPAVPLASALVTPPVPQSAALPLPDTDSWEPRPRRVRLMLLIGIATVAVLTTIVVILSILPDHSNHAGASATQSTSATTTPARPTLPTTTTPTRPSTNTAPPTQSANPKNVPVRVFNNSKISGLAEKAMNDFKADGWNVVGTGNYQESTIPTTTAFFRPGTEEEPAARELAAKFNMDVAPRLAGVARYGPGVIVILESDYDAR